MGLALLGIAGSAELIAQQGLAPYTPSRTTGITYTSISGTGTSPAFFRAGLSTDDNLSTFLPVGFNFIYDGVQVNAFQISTNGFINLLANTGALGSSSTSYGWVNDNTFTTAGATVRVIAPFYDDHQTAGNLGTLTDLQNSMKYETTGAPGSRVCTIEWVNIQDFNAGSTSSYNFQIKLYETSNNIEFVYGTMTHGGPGTRTFSVGLNSSTLAGVSPFPTTMLFAQQVANSATFSGTAMNTHPVASLPASNSSILFTYGGVAPAPMSGVYTIPGSFASFTAAINALNYNGLSGAATFNVAAGSAFVESPPTLQIGAQSFGATFQKSGAGANPVIQASGGAGTADFAVRIWGGSNINFNGIDITATSSLLEFGYGVQQYTNLIGAQNMTFENMVITMNRTNTTSIGILQSSSVTPALVAAGANSNNTWRNFTVRNSNSGVQFNGAAAVTYNGIAQTISPDNNNQITTTACGTYNIIGDPGTPNDIGGNAVATQGIFFNAQANYVIENCKIQNMTSSGAVRVDGIVANSNTFLALVSGGTSRINNNQIFTLRSTSTGTSVVSGIRLNNNINAGTNVRVFNNSIGDLSSTSTSITSRRILGISLQDVGTGNPSTMEIWNNSVRLAPAGIGCNNACLELLTSTTGPVVTLRNNIFSNETGAQVTVKHYCIVSSSATIFGAAGSSSNNNDLYIANATNGFVGLGATTDYALLANWQAGITTPAGIDANSKSVAPVFVAGPNDLHLDATNVSNQTNLFGAGATLPGYITNDIDCVARAAAPTMGVDEIIAPACAGLPAATTSSTTTPTRCAGQTAALANNAVNFASGIAFQWQVGPVGGPYVDVSGGSGATTQAYTTGALVAGTYGYVLRVRCTNEIIPNGDSFSNEVTITVNPTPTSVPTSNSPVCTGTTLNLFGGTDVGTVYSWTGPNAFADATQNPSIALVTAAAAGVYTYTATLGSCSSAANTTTVVVNTTPTVPVMTPTSATACAGIAVPLSALSSALTTASFAGGALTINAAGNATPYPSTVAVSGLPVTGVTVKRVLINGITHTWGDDIDILLQSPTGTNVVIMSDPGPASSGSAVSNVNYVFQDGAAVMSNVASNPSGTYALFNDGVPDTWSAPGPGSFSQASPTLALFTGNMNGTWNLMINDDTGGDAGSVASWSVEFEYNGVTYAWAPPTGLNTTVGPNVISTATGTETYTVTASNANLTCTAQNTVMVTRNPLPVLVCPGNFSVCSNDAIFALSGATPTGGTYSGPGVSAGNFDPSSGAGPHLITYNYTDGNGCIGVACTFTITVNTAPTIVCPADFSVCSNDAIFALSGATPVGGTYSGTGVSGGNFDPSSGIGGHLITYSYTDGNGCTNTACTFTITVNQAQVYYADTDGDGLGFGASTGTACAPPNAGDVTNNTDPCPTVFNGNPGDACNDGNAFTFNDVLGASPSCACAGTACTTNLTLFFQLDAASTENWEIRAQGTNTLIQSGSVNLGIAGTISVTTCVPNGCFYLRVTDDGGDGITGGGYLLRTTSPAHRLIDNLDNGANFTTTSQIVGNQGWCIPLGNDRLISASCDRKDLQRGVNAACSEKLTADNTPNGTSGNVYQFWVYNPNGTESQYIPAIGLSPQSNILSMNQITLPAGKLYNVRVRTRISPGVWREWGPACRMSISLTATPCRETSLVEEAGPNFSCGKTVVLPTPPQGNGGANMLVAKPATRLNVNCVEVQANKYQFRFVDVDDLSVDVLTSNNYFTHMTTANFGACREYTVEVRASFDAGATWCPYSKVCTVYTGGCIGGGGENSVAENTGLSMYPNPNRGDQLMLSLENVAADVRTVSVDIYDAFGKRVSARTIAVQDGFLNTVLELNGELSAGMYNVSITAGDVVYSERLVIQP